MDNLDTVTFGGFWDDRAAHLRGDAAEQAHMRADPSSRAVPLWRGKPLMVGDALGWVSLDADVLDYARDALLFLGLSNGVAHYAVDISAWEPDALDETSLAMFFDPSEQHHASLPPDHLFRELRACMTQLSATDAAMASTARALFHWHRTHGFCAACGSASEWAMAGWQRNCPSCSAQHFPRTDPVVIMLVTRNNRVLLGRSPGWPEGMYSLLAGFVEPGETIESAVRREVQEETGVKTGAVQYVTSQPWPFPASLMFGCSAEALSDEITLDDELEDALWVSREDLVDVFGGVHATIKPARKGAIAHYLLENWLAGRI
jgi:NAD+ diphosphatase